MVRHSKRSRDCIRIYWNERLPTPPEVITYPIAICRNPYRGRDLSKRESARKERQQAEKLERYLNERLLAQAEPIWDYRYAVIARETDIELSLIRKLCFPIDSGHHGFTAYRKDLSSAEALELIQSGMQAKEHLESSMPSTSCAGEDDC